MIACLLTSIFASVCKGFSFTLWTMMQQIPTAMCKWSTHMYIDAKDLERTIHIDRVQGLSVAGEVGRLVLLTKQIVGGDFPNALLQILTSVDATQVSVCVFFSIPKWKSSGSHESFEDRFAHVEFRAVGPWKTRSDGILEEVSLHIHTFPLVRMTFLFTLS